MVERWRWFDENTLVLDEGPRSVVLAANDGELCTHDNNNPGVLRSFDPEETRRGRMIRMAPEMAHLLQDLLTAVEKTVDPDRLQELVEQFLHGEDAPTASRTAEEILKEIEGVPS